MKGALITADAEGTPPSTISHHATLHRAFWGGKTQPSRWKSISISSALVKRPPASAFTHQPQLHSWDIRYWTKTHGTTFLTHHKTPEVWNFRCLYVNPLKPHKDNDPRRPMLRISHPKEKTTSSWYLAGPQQGAIACTSLFFSPGRISSFLTYSYPVPRLKISSML